MRKMMIPKFNNTILYHVKLSNKRRPRISASLEAWKIDQAPRRLFELIWFVIKSEFDQMIYPYLHAVTEQEYGHSLSFAADCVTQLKRVSFCYINTMRW